MNKMTIAIVNVKGSFSEYWIEYCVRHNIEFRIVNPYSSDIVRQVEGCGAFMWHFSHVNHKDMQCARSIIYSLESIGVRCFPDRRTCWHFDDKIAQKYLLECVGAPLVKSYVFYDREEALAWARETVFPKVFKLKGGAGSSNVMMAHNSAEAISFINKSFGKGFRQYRWREQFVEAWGKFRHRRATVREVLRPLKLAMMRYPTSFDHYAQREIGYAYFQDFVPGNEYDIRVVVIGKRAFALKRLVRSGDFRASGSGDILYDKKQIDERCVEIAFDVNEKLRAQCIAFDFVFDEMNRPLIVEISYGFSPKAYFRCEGYWSENMVWHEGVNFDFCGWMVEQVLLEDYVR